MASGFGVDSDHLPTHAGHVGTVQTRFDTIKGTTGCISQDDRTSEQLCRWITAIVESGHRWQDELNVSGEENLSLAVQGLRKSASDHEGGEALNTDKLGATHKQVGR